MFSYPRRLVRKWGSAQRLVSKLRKAHSNPEIFYLSFASSSDGEILPCTSQLIPNSNKRPLIFIHGAQYKDAQEALRDLVRPFLANAKLHDISQHFDVYVCSWNSYFVCVKSHRCVRLFLNRVSFVSRYLFIYSHGRKFFADVERRACDAARAFAPFLKQIYAKAQKPPMVVSHSMGALVWAELVRQMTHDNHLPARLGTWWNLQPALADDVFTPKGAYADVFQAYQTRFGRYEMWFSRWDLVLAYGFRLFKRRRALGQKGCRQALGPQFDLSSVSADAHGVFAISRRKGNFFERASAFLNERLRVELLSQ